MKHLCLLILSYSGLVCVGWCKPREYILIKQLKTWTDAQAYCRLNHYDLATVQTAEDEINLRQTASENAFTSYGWIGLYNDINSWRWSHQDESVTFDRWIIGQPDNYGAGEACAVIRYGGNWFDRVCTEEKRFLCFEEKNSTVKYYLVENLMTWSDARKHCRDQYTDLVTIRDETENEKLRLLMYWSTEVWIGLFRDSWKWSDGSNLSASNEAAAEMLNGGNENCATSTYNGYMGNWLCSTTFNFYCSTMKFKRQILKVQVKFKLGNVDDARLQTLVMKKGSNRQANLPRFALALYDSSLCSVITTDACDYGLGAVFAQIQPDAEAVIDFLITVFSCHGNQETMVTVNRPQFPRLSLLSSFRPGLQQTLDGLTADEDLKMKWRKQKNGNVFQKQIDLPKSANGSSVCKPTSL